MGLPGSHRKIPPSADDPEGHAPLIDLHLSTIAVGYARPVDPTIDDGDEAPGEERQVSFFVHRQVRLRVSPSPTGR
jgi:hypothetical protein